ncbi:MAG: hypothetical protein C0498_13530 [Anaerolinea sp.]|nr:hypothetical protein [Anaerolinea sp.]
MFAIFVSGSRSGWFAVGVAIIVVGALWLGGRDRRRQTRTWLAAKLSRGRGRGRLAAGGGIVIATAVVVALAPVILRRLGEGGEDLRFNYLLAAGRMFAEAPILGTGPGTWVIQRVRYTYAPETDYYIPHAHNLYAQTLSELGLVGALAGVLILILLARLLGGAIRDQDPVRRRWGWAATFALAYFAAHNLLDFYANMPAILFAAVLPVAWLDATAHTASMPGARDAPAPRAPPVRVGQAIGAIAIALALVGYGLSEMTAVVHADAVAAYDEGEWARADVLAQEAVTADPAWPPYQFTAGLTAAAVGDHERAADAFRRSAVADDLPEAWLDLAAEETLLGNEDAAREALQRATRLGLQRPALAMAIGDLAARLGEADLSSTAFAAAIAKAPSLAGDPWWQADPDRAARFSAIVDAAIDLAAPDMRWQIALMAGDADRARSLADALDATSGEATPVDVIDAWLGDDDALARIVAAWDARPLDGFALAAAARLESRRGNTATAWRLREAAFVGTGGSGMPFEATETRVSDQVLVGRTVAGGVADFWGTYTYRRHTPWNPLVPSLIQLSNE